MTNTPPSPKTKLAKCLGLFIFLSLLSFTPSSFGQDEDIEYRIGGQYRLRSFSLRNGSFSRQLDVNTRRALQQSGVRSVDEQQNFFDTRMRLKFTASRGNTLSLNTQFEIGDLTFGGNGAQLGNDGVNVETKWLYLEWTPPALPLTFRGGLFSEVTPKSLVLSNDVAGLKAVYSPFGGAVTMSFDYIKAIDNSRNDIDSDGLLDDDFNDRDIFYVRTDISKFQPFVFGVYGLAEIDNTQDSPVAANTERDVYWVAGYLKGQISRVSFSIDGVYAFGDVRNAGPGGSNAIQGYAFDARLSFNFSLFGIELIAGWGSGDDPKTSRIEAFPTITTFYAHSNIIFDDYGGFNVTGSNISGVGHISVLLKATPIENLELKGIFIWAMYTEDPRRASNVNRLNLRGRELGIEIGLNADYTVNENMKFISRSGMFLPKTGYLTTFDTPDDRPLYEVILGVEFRF